MTNLINEIAAAKTATEIESSQVAVAALKPALPPRATTTTSKTDLVLKQLRSKRGATAAALMEPTGWQAHSVRGFLSGTVRKKLGLNLTGEVGKDGRRRYRIVREAA